jgi:hypothetical protein
MEMMLRILLTRSLALLTVAAAMKNELLQYLQMVWILFCLSTFQWSKIEASQFENSKFLQMVLRALHAEQ